MTSPYILYCNRDSGHSYKVALALRLLALPATLVPIDLVTPRPQRPEEFQAVSRFGEVPVLVTPDGAIVQSNAILLDLARRTTRFSPTHPAEQRRMEEWLFWEANRIGFSLPNLRFYRSFAARFGVEAPPALTEWLDSRTRSDLDRLSEDLAAAPYLGGAAPSMADLSCCAYLFWADQAGISVEDWPPVARWLDRIRALPGWQHPYDLFPVIPLA